MKKLQKIFVIIALILALPTLGIGQGTKHFTAYNKIKFDYEVIFPKGYEKGKSYELAMVFTEIEPSKDDYASGVKAIRENESLKNTILFIPKNPIGESDWISHPIHHGLNDLMKSLRASHGNKNQKFHFIGYKLGGRVAQTYSKMSSQFVKSLIFAHSDHWKITKQEYFDKAFSMGFNIHVYDSKRPEKFPLDISKAKYKQSENLQSAISLIDKSIDTH